MAFVLHTPETIKQAVRLQRETGGEYLAGGTVLLVRHAAKPIDGHVISLQGIPGLKGIGYQGPILRIGALTTFTEMHNSGLLGGRFKALDEVSRIMGGPQVRNRGTLGGNIGSNSSAADAVTALVALDAVIRREGNLITCIELSDEKVAASAFAKVGRRNAMAVSVANMAVARMTDGSYRVAVGSCAPTVLFCEKTSAVLSSGGTFDEAALALQSEIQPRTDRWGTEEYRRAVCPNLLERLLAEVAP